MLATISQLYYWYPWLQKWNFNNEQSTNLTCPPKLANARVSPSPPRQNDATGHDATEDALAALRLVQRKLTRGYTYGDAAQGGYVPSMNGSGPEPEDDGALPAAVNVDGYYTSLLGRVQEVGVTSE